MSTDTQGARPSKNLALEAVRGLAALIVVNHHLMLGFCSNLDQTATFHLSPWIKLWSNGNFAVSLFFILSGFVLSISFHETGSFELLKSSACRRYFRLAIPAASSVLLSYLILKSGLYFNREVAEYLNLPDKSWMGGYNAMPPSFVNALKEGIFGAYFEFTDTSSYNNVLWTMREELVGSMFIFSFLALTHGLRNRPWIYGVVGVVLVLVKQETFLLFLMGSALCEISALETWRRITNNNRYFPRWLTLLLVCISLTAFTPEWLELKFEKKIPGYNYFQHALEFTILFCLISSRKLQELLENRFCLFLGRISFLLYLCHLLVMYSMGSYLYLKLAKELDFTHWTAFCCTAFTTYAISMILGWIGSRTIDPLSINVGRSVYTRLFKA